MAKVSTNISIDSDIKAEAQAMLADFGLDLSTAVNIFLRQMIRENAIPFAIQREGPRYRGGGEGGEDDSGVAGGVYPGRETGAASSERPGPYRSP